MPKEVTEADRVMHIHTSSFLNHLRFISESLSDQKDGKLRQAIEMLNSRIDEIRESDKARKLSRHVLIALRDVYQCELRDRQPKGVSDGKDN